MRVRRRWVAAGGAGLVVLLLAVFVLVTDVGAPSDHYSSPPDPCQLLSDGTVRELVGDTMPPTRGERSGEKMALHRWPDQRWCISRGSQIGSGTLAVFAYRFYSTQLRLGPTGAGRAADQFEFGRELSREVHQRDCSVELHDARGSACGVRTDLGFSLHIVRENLYVNVDLLQRDPGVPEPWPEELLAELTEEVMSRLDDQP